MKKSDRVYLTSIILALVCIIVLTAVAYYAYGVIEKSKTIDQLEKYTDILSENIQSAVSSDNNEILDEIRGEYSSKTRTVSIVMKNYGAVSFDGFLEEMRVAIGAEEISISDSEGNITDSTNMYSEGGKIKDTFIEHLNDTVYTESIFIETEDGYKILSATKRTDNKGIIQVTYSADNFVDKIGTSQIYSCINEITSISDAKLAVIDERTNRYIISADASAENTPADIPGEKFEKESGKLTEIVQGVNSFVYYKKISVSDDINYVVISFIPVITTKKLCTVVAEWVFAVSFIVSAVMILSFRNSLLKMNSEKSKVDG